MRKNIFCECPPRKAFKSKILLCTKVREDGLHFGSWFCGTCGFSKKIHLPLYANICPLCLSNFLSPVAKTCRSCHNRALRVGALSAARHPWRGFLWLSSFIQQERNGDVWRGSEGFY